MQRFDKVIQRIYLKKKKVCVFFTILKGLITPGRRIRSTLNSSYMQDANSLTHSFLFWKHLAKNRSTDEWEIWQISSLCEVKVMKKKKKIRIFFLFSHFLARHFVISDCSVLVLLPVRVLPWQRKQPDNGGFFFVFVFKQKPSSIPFKELCSFASEWLECSLPLSQALFLTRFDSSEHRAFVLIVSGGTKSGKLTAVIWRFYHSLGSLKCTESFVKLTVLPQTWRLK